MKALGNDINVKVLIAYLDNGNGLVLKTQRHKLNRQVHKVGCNRRST